MTLQSMELNKEQIKPKTSRRGNNKDKNTEISEIENRSVGNSQ